jgi:IS30 family transposase
MDLSPYSQAALNAVAQKLNERPRKTLNYETLAQRFHQSVAFTVESANVSGHSRS